MSTSTITESIFTTQTRALDLLRQGSEATAKALESWTEFVGAQTKALLPEGMDLTALTPVTDAIPSPTKAVATSFSFLEDMVAQQRQMAEKVLGAQTPAPTSKK